MRLATKSLEPQSSDLNSYRCFGPLFLRILLYHQIPLIYLKIILVRQGSGCLMGFASGFYTTTMNLVLMLQVVDSAC